MTPTQIRLDKILMPDPVAAGMNYLVVASLIHLFRSSNEHTTPITLRREGKFYRIVDGRHRFVASVMAGRKRVLAIVEDS